jgi:hypothetical protein
VADCGKDLCQWGYLALMANVLEIPPVLNGFDDGGGQVLEIPPPPVDYILFSTDADFLLQQYQMFTWPDAPPCPGGSACWAYFHEANTGFWIQGPGGICTGGCVVQDPENSINCGPGGCFPTEGCVGWAEGDNLYSPHVLSDIFPFWALVAYGYDPNTPVVFDDWFLACDVGAIITWNGPQELPCCDCPPGWTEIASSAPNDCGGCLSPDGRTSILRTRFRGTCPVPQDPCCGPNGCKVVCAGGKLILVPA